MSSTAHGSMTLNVRLRDSGLQEYRAVLACHGFESWHDLIDITEEDMAELNFKRGHRRKLQRAIASFHGKSFLEPLVCSSPTVYDPYKGGRPPSSQAEQSNREARPSVLLKRRYQRHLPKDPHTPQRPRSGYVLFANFLRQNPHVSDLSFEDIAKLVGQEWRRLSPKEIAVWMNSAAEQRSRYEADVSNYQQTGDYQRHQGIICTHIERKLEHEIVLPQSAYFSSRRLSKDSSTIIPAPPDQGDNAIFGECVPTSMSSSSTLQDFDEAKTREPYDNDILCRSTHGHFQTALRLPILYSSWSSIPQNQQSIFCPDLTNLDTELLALRASQPNQEIRDHYIQDLNPFHIVSKAAIWPLLDSFLQRVNTLYNFIDAEYLVRQFLQAVDSKNTLPTYVMYTLCFCMSIGCQAHVVATDEMAIIWHENGRRYLDNDGWGMNPNGVRALALMAMFHMTERPATAHRYLGVALKIGTEHNLLKNGRNALYTDGSSGDEWAALLGTIERVSELFSKRQIVTSI